ncbi:MAG: toll/interleukin-1 receptor domain-containing protein, partial [Sphingomonadales bacterium]
ISYSHQDAAALERLHVHLANLQREGRIETWYDRDILGGDVVDDEIDRELEAADLVLLLVSPDFIASHYCVEREMRRALERHDAGETRVVPIIIEPCDWAAMPQLRRLKAVPNDGNPISEWANANNAYLNVVQELRRIIDAGDASAPEPAAHQREPVSLQQRGVPRYRVQRDFDDIDRSEFREAAFAAIKDYFRNAIDEINSVDGLRGRFVDLGATCFGGTVVNGSRQNGTAHITVHCRNARFALGDIYYSFSENAAENTANGGFDVSSDEYEQFLIVTISMFGGHPDRLNPEQAAEHLWNQYIEQAGIIHA